MSPIVQKRGGRPIAAALQGLTSSGPVVLFDTRQTALVVSPLDNFKSAVHTHSNRSSGAAWEMGVGSEIIS
eukprot:SAG11_NODE_26641_length_342_cov_1.683128_1_plen_70_part_01